MTARILPGHEAEKIGLKPYFPPTREEIELKIAEKQRQGGGTGCETGTLKIPEEKEYRAKTGKQILELQQDYLDSLEEMAKLKQGLSTKSGNPLIEPLFFLARQIIDGKNTPPPGEVLQMLKKALARLNRTKGRS